MMLSPNKRTLIPPDEKSQQVGGCSNFVSCTLNEMYAELKLTPSIKIGLALAAFVAFAGSAHPSFAQSSVAQKCGDVLTIMQYALQGVRPENSEFSMGRDGQTYFMLMISKVDQARSNDKSGLFAPWRLMERQGQSTTYCLIGAGDQIEVLESIQNVPTPRTRYGMPGSGYQRCSNGNDIRDAIDVRIWANKELGQSFTVYLTSDIGDKNYTFLMSNDHYWIILNDEKKNIAESCFYSRGNETITHYDMPVVKPK